MSERDIFGKGHGVQHSQWSHSMENIKLCKSRNWGFFAFRFFPLRGFFQFSSYSHFKFRDFDIVGQSRDVQHSHWHHSMANINLHSHNGHFWACSYRLRNIIILNIRSWKFRSRSLGRKKLGTPFDGEYQTA